MSDYKCLIFPDMKPDFYRNTRVQAVEEQLHINYIKPFVRAPCLASDIKLCYIESRILQAYSTVQRELNLSWWAAVPPAAQYKQWTGCLIHIFNSISALRPMTQRMKRSTYKCAVLLIPHGWKCPSFVSDLWRCDIKLPLSSVFCHAI
jgi:hypothetical protein